MSATGRPRDFRQPQRSPPAQIGVSGDGSRQDPALSFIVVTFNGANAIVNCLRSIFMQSLRPAEVIVVDNNSADQTRQLVQTEFPGAKLVVNDRNLGYAAANNIGVRIASGSVICAINQDVTLDADWSLEMLNFLLSHERCGAAEGKLYLSDHPKILNSGGSYVNLLGFGCATRYGEEDSGDKAPKIVSYPSGAAFAVRKQAFDDVGGFDESYFMYHEDVDLGLRLRRAGWSVFYVPSATASHAYDSSVRSWKIELLERNRWKTMVKDFPHGYFFRCGPLVLIFEIAVSLQLLSLGFFGAKIRATLGFLKDLRKISRTRYTTGERSSQLMRDYAGLTDEMPATLSIDNRWVRLAKKLQTKYRKAFLNPRASDEPNSG